MKRVEQNSTCRITRSFAAAKEFSSVVMETFSRFRDQGKGHRFHGSA